MKIIISTTLLVAVVLAEPPPSLRPYCADENPSLLELHPMEADVTASPAIYLPPSTRNQQGYPQGPPAGFSASAGPQVVAARTLENRRAPHVSHDSHGPSNDFARSSPHDIGVHGRSGQSGYPGSEQGYDHNASPFSRNALDDAKPEPANYNFGYMVNDYHEGTDFGHHEERQDEKALGEYHVVLPDGRKQTVSYEADERGFKPHISYQDADSDSLGRSNGYDSNANNLRNAGPGHHGNGLANGGGHHSNARNGGY